MTLPRLTLFGLFAFLLCTAQFVEAQDTSRAHARKLAEDALRQYLKDFDIDAARVGFAASIAADSSYSPAYFNLGLLSEAAGRLDEAIQLYQQAQRLSKDASLKARAATYHAAAVARKKQNATADGRRSAEYVDRLRKAEALLNGGLAAAALAEAGRAATLDPTRWESYAVAAHAARNSRQYTEADLFLGKAVERAPSGVKLRLEQIRQTMLAAAGDPALLSQALGSFYDGRYTEAAASFDKLARNSSDDRYLLLLAIATNARGERDAALNLVQRLSAASSNSLVKAQATVLLKKWQSSTTTGVPSQLR
jgi:tetratricopeptide (TPR) repeat protein